MERYRVDKPSGARDLSGRTLRALWPKPECPACTARPAVVGVPHGEEEPVFPVTCPACGRGLPAVVLVIGVDDDAL